MKVKCSKTGNYMHFWPAVSVSFLNKQSPCWLFYIKEIKRLQRNRLKALLLVWNILSMSLLKSNKVCCWFFFFVNQWNYIFFTIISATTKTILTGLGIQSNLSHSPDLKPHLQIHSLQKHQIQTTGIHPHSDPPTSCNTNNMTLYKRCIRCSRFEASNAKCS